MVFACVVSNNNNIIIMCSCLHVPQNGAFWHKFF